MKHLYSYRDLLAYRVLSEARKEARQFYLGVLWWILEPVAQVVALYLMFGVLLGRGGADYIGFLAVGLVFWRWFESSCLTGMQSMVSATPILTHVHIAAWVFPVTNMLSLAMRFLFVLALLILFATIYSGQFGAAYLALPLTLLLNLVLILSIGTLLSVIPPFFPDSLKIVGNLFMLLFFFSGIFLDISQLGARAANYLYLNPVAVLIDIYRGIMLEGQLPPAEMWIRVTVTTFAAFAAALLVYRVQRRTLTKALLQ